MRLIRSLLALAMLAAGNWLLDRAAGLRAARPAPDLRAPVVPLPYRPVDRMLIGSIISLAICTLWIWISARAGR